ncbi:MAG: DUF3833 domain-containing protein [Gammaproteobacteria bacterium]|jgi:hypothetical protein
MFLRLTFVALVVSLTACTTMRPEDFAGTTPELRLEEYFLGHTRAWGMVQNRSGKPTRYFTVDIQGRREGEELVLREDFVFRDGERSQRTWRIRKLDEHRYQGTAGDVVGTASGRRYGNALNWQYDLLLTVDDRQWKVHFNDWMFLHEDGVVVNRAEMTKLGVRVGEILLFFRKV